MAVLECIDLARSRLEDEVLALRSLVGALEAAARGSAGEGDDPPWVRVFAAHVARLAAASECLDDLLVADVRPLLA